MSYFQVIKLVLTLAVEFGPGVVAIARKIHQLVERRAPTEGWDSDAKARAFDRNFKKLAAGSGYSDAEVAVIREGIWRAHNRTKKRRKP